MLSCFLSLAFLILEEEQYPNNKKAEKALDRAFDIREFHDQVLQDGCLPLSYLESKINKWIEAKAESIKYVAFISMSLC